MLNTAAWIIFGIAFLCLLTLYQRGVAQRNHLTAFIGELLLFDDVYAHQKKGFDDWIRASTATNAAALSAGALLAIQDLSERLANGDPKEPFSSSVWGFHAKVWDRKQQLEGKRPTSTSPADNP
jgi:hypothetical protein